VDYDKTNIASTYSQARDHGPAVLKLWMDVVAAHVEGEAVRTVLDLGCGTGRFSQALATRFDSAVVGIDPSSKMLDQARRNVNHPRVFYAGGSAEALPMSANSVDLIFISMVFHHFTDPEGAARECRRVLRKNGRVCLRTATRDSIPAYPYLPYFPASRPLLEQRLPSLDSQRRAFESASFQTMFSGCVVQEVASNYAVYADKLSLKADSILVSLNDDEFEAGIRALRSEKPEGPIVEPIDFVVFEKQS
jgi:ubiquinone/menaquinone biosynthesis C-methylase UbiE